MKSGRQNVLRIRFAEQLFQMGNFEKCKRVLREVLDTDAEPNGDSVIFSFHSSSSMHRSVSTA